MCSFGIVLLRLTPKECANGEVCMSMCGGGMRFWMLDVEQSAHCYLEVDKLLFLHQSS